MQLVQRPQGQTVEGQIRFNGEDMVYDIAQTPTDRMEKIRGAQISMIFQEPMTSLNPVFRAGHQIDEVIKLHNPEMTNEEVKAQTLKMIDMVGIANQEGVYMMFSGPTFESPAEIVFSRTVGASAVGMSTVPEAIAAAHCGIKTIGISLITNMAAGILDQPLSHEEVQETAAIASEKFTKLVDKIVETVF